MTTTEVAAPAVTSTMLTTHADLAAAIAAFQLTSGRPTVPVLGCARFDPAGRVCEVFDYETHVRYQLGCAAAAGEPFLIERGVLGKVIKSFTVGSTARKVADKEILVQSTGPTATVSGDGYVYSATYQPNTEDFPAAPEPPKGAVTFTLPRQALDDAEALTFSAGTDGTLPMLTGVYMDGTAPGRLAFATTDRFRLSTRGVRTNHRKPFKALVPASTLAKTVKVLPAGDVTVTVWDTGTTHGHIRLSAGPVAVTTRLLDVEFVKYQSLLPKPEDLTTICRVSPVLLATTINRVCATLDPKHGRVLLTFDGSTVRVSAHDGSDTTAVGRPMPCESTCSNGLTIAFTPRYLTEGLAQFDGDVVLGATTGNRPMLMAASEAELGDPDAYRYLVMPQHLPRN